MSSFTTEAFTLLGIGLGVIFLRTYARLSKGGLAGFKPDDYLMLLAAVSPLLVSRTSLHSSLLTT